MKSRLRRAPRTVLTLATLLPAAAGVLPATARAVAPEKPYIVVYDPATPAASRAATAQISAAEDITPTRQFTATVKGFAARLDASDVAALRDDPRVAAVTPDRPVRATGMVPLAAGDAIPTGVRRVGAAPDGSVHEASPVNVAVLDTGIDLGNPDLNAVAGRTCAGSGAPTDGNGHGTHVAGTIAARDNGSGVVGISPGTKLWAVRVLDATGAGSTSSLICGIDWVTSTRTDADPTNDIAVANMSLGGAAPSSVDCGRSSGDALHIAICASVAAGVTYVVAAGNSSTDLQGFVPASYPEVLTVTAVSDSDGLGGARGGTVGCIGNADDSAASYSNFATRAADVAHLIAAPGSCIASTAAGGGIRVMSGTSMATPHVTGLVALCEGDGGAKGPCWGKSPGDVRTILRQAASDQASADPSFEFTGSPTAPVLGRTYGYLATARLSSIATPAPTTPVTTTAPAATVRPAMSGTAAVGSTLTATQGTWTGTAPIAYVTEWLRCTTTATTSCTAIAGARAATYVATRDDAGRYLRVRVTATNAKGTTVALSDATALVATPPATSRPGPPVPTAAPAIGGTVRAGSPLTASTGTWTGTNPMTFTVNWATCPPRSSICSYNGATGTTYTPPASTPAGTRFVIVVAARNASGAAYAQSAPTATL